MQEGWVKVHRAMLDNAVMQDDWLCRLWMWCLLKARPASSQFKNERLTAGQFVTGRSSASEQLNVSPSKWYRGMQELEKLGCITTIANSNWTTVTVCNWTTYQARKEQERTASEQQMNSERTADEQPADTSKELKNLRTKETKELKKEEENTICSESAVGGSKLVDDSPVVMIFPIVGKAKEWNLTEAKLAEYAESYPGVDCMAAARAARQWCIDNPTRRKTHKGMPAFLSGWLGRNQNKGGVQLGMFKNPADPRGTLSAREQYLAMEGLTNG